MASMTESSEANRILIRMEEGKGHYFIDDDSDLEETGLTKASSCGKLMGRNIKDWSNLMTLLGVGGVSGGGFLSWWQENPWIGGIAIAAAVAIMLLQSGRISCLKPEKQRKKEKRQLKFTAQRLGCKRQGLKIENKNLKERVQTLESSINQFGSILKIPEEDMDAACNKTVLIEKKLDTFVDIFSQYQEIAKYFNEEVRTLNKSTKQVKAGVSGSKGKKRIIDSDTSDEEDTYQSARDFNKTQKKELKILHATFKKNFQSIQKNFYKLRDQLEKAKQNQTQIFSSEDSSSENSEYSRKIPQNSQTVIELLDRVSKLENLLAEQDENMSEYSSDGADEREISIPTDDDT